MKFFLWGIYWPLLRLLSALLFWVPALQKRRAFERKNLSDPLSASFHEGQARADLCFEFSSEGEFQQVAPLVDDALALGKRLELVLFSPSVEKAVMNLAARYPQQIRYLRFPLLTLAPWGRSSLQSWISAKRLIQVRYDLFPELLAWAREKDHELILLWTTFKKERSKESSVSWLKQAFLKSARLRVYASVLDQEEGSRLGFPGPVYDFRMEQIRRRISGKAAKFATQFPQYEGLKNRFGSYPREKRLLFGNAWPSDLFLLQQLPADLFVLVVPHQLSENILSEFRTALKGIGRNVVDVSEATQVVGEGNCFLLNKKGVLCELYADFGLAYVGGGFEDGVHSILEPLVSGSDAIACGKGHHRSTEYDIARSFGVVTEVLTAEAFTAWTRRGGGQALGGKLGPVFQQYETFKKDVISC